MDELDEVRGDEPSGPPNHVGMIIVVRMANDLWPFHGADEGSFKS
jgi:hypothetical protein